MKKGEKKFTLSNRWLYTFIFLGILLLISTGIYAYGTSSPSTFGHSGGELDLNGMGNIVSSGYIHGNIVGGNGNLASSAYEISGTNVAGQTVYAYGSICVGNSAHDCSGSGGTVITTGSTTALHNYNILGTYSTSFTYSIDSVIGNYDPANSGIYGQGYYGVKGNGGHVGVMGTSYAGSSSIGVLGQGYKAVRGYGDYIGIDGGSSSSSGYDFYAFGQGTNYGASSSIRWKNNISEIPDALNKILKLRGVYYNWNEDHGGKYDMGFIAEEVGEFVPEIVGYDDETNDSNWYTDENGNKKLYATGVDYGALTPMLVEAIKEQQKIIDNQESEINSLNEKLNKICTKLPSLCE